MKTNASSKNDWSTDPTQIKSRSIAGVLTYTTRTLLVQLITFIATLFLAAFLSPADFGIFFLVSSIVNLFVFLSDIGLAASLIQKKEPPNQTELSTVFIIQQLLALFIFSLIIVLTPIWQHQLNLQIPGMFLLYALGFSFILASLKTIPSILLERSLEFHKLVIPQIVEAILFYTTAVTLAWKGYGVTSYTIAVLMRGIGGLISIYWLKPWKPKLTFSKDALIHLMKFGVPFQVNDLMARIKDDLLFVVVKKFITESELGFIGWAKRWSVFPFRFTVDSIVRVTFPAYSRLQEDKPRLAKALEKSLFFISLTILPILLGMAGMAYPLTIIIPSYTKWQPALPAFYIFIIDVIFSSISVPLTNALNALGKIKLTLKLMVFWTSSLWLLTFPAIKIFGFNGIPIATVIVASTSVIVVYIIKRFVPVNIINQITLPFFASLVMLATLLRLQSFASQSLTKFIATIAIGAIVYASLIVIIARKRLVDEIKTIIMAKKAKVE